MEIRTRSSTWRATVGLLLLAPLLMAIAELEIDDAKLALHDIEIETFDDYGLDNFGDAFDSFELDFDW